MPYQLGDAPVNAKISIPIIEADVNPISPGFLWNDIKNSQLFKLASILLISKGFKQKFHTPLELRFELTHVPLG